MRTLSLLLPLMLAGCSLFSPTELPFDPPATADVDSPAERENDSDPTFLNPTGDHLEYLVGGRVEFTGRFIRGGGLVAGTLDVNGTKIDVQGDFGTEASTAKLIRVSGILTLVNYAQLIGQGAPDMDQYLLKVDEWQVVD